ncbi:hypothetical protein NLI96_g13346 [Meripilus lineatus]|uniref:Uncharacterized protein n=1 Tax=Meripilus lineatus TaxID=2056292 RepID=A0AAD5USY0_9APHY|nr:hypothetical protein NLI96_g13346 [Physisporinus lineatus]
MLTPDQYAKNVATVPKSSERVEFAIRLPAATPARVTRAGVAADRREIPARGLRAADRCAGARRFGGSRGSGACARSARADGGAYDRREVCRAPHTTDFALLFLAGPRGSYAGDPAPPGADRPAAARLSRDGGRADDADRAAEQPADGLPHAGDRAALERSVAGAGGGQDRVRQVRRCARAHEGAARNGHAFDRGRRAAAPV